MNRKKIIQATIGLMAIATSFLPQKASADCSATCWYYGGWTSCSYSGPGGDCGCYYGVAYCHG